MLSHPCSPCTSQVEVNKQTASQKTAAVGHGNAVFKTLTKVATRISAGSGYYRPSLKHPAANLLKMPSKMAQLLVQTTPFSKDLDQHDIQTIRLLIKVPKVLTRFCPVF